MWWDIILLASVIYGSTAFINYKNLAIWLYLWFYEQLLKAYKVFIVLIGGD